MPPLLFLISPAQEPGIGDVRSAASTARRWRHSPRKRNPGHVQLWCTRSTAYSSSLTTSTSPWEIRRRVSGRPSPPSSGIPWEGAPFEGTSDGGEGFFAAPSRDSRSKTPFTRASARAFCSRGIQSNRSFPRATLRARPASSCRWGSRIFHSPRIWEMTKRLSPRTTTSARCLRAASSRSKINASYSASLFVRFPRKRPSSKSTSPLSSRRTAPAAAGPGFPREPPSKKPVQTPTGRPSSFRFSWPRTSVRPPCAAPPPWRSRPGGRRRYRNWRGFRDWARKR